MTLRIEWERDPTRLDALIAFFIDNVSRQYISHGEVLDQRADTFQQWSADLPAVLHAELARCFQSDSADTSSLAVMEVDGAVCGLALVERVRRRSGDMAILSDLVVSTALRGRGLGADLLRWIERELSTTGIKMLLLESGISNQPAHAFFEHHGYETTSLAMCKSLGSSSLSPQG